eukprot:TRINITY_DN13597_c0_g4_i1.p1 TRINITY_DN13597_c0_g4~~TRINITY_DN13597_c0_g4_i1.p1  ORF type:complete len:708 (-),score=83.12 TRINITY_DN13597_c0_g4_i1:518-2614(-)
MAPHVRLIDTGDATPIPCPASCEPSLSRSAACGSVDECEERLRRELIRLRDLVVSEFGHAAVNLQMHIGNLKHELSLCQVVEDKNPALEQERFELLSPLSGLRLTGTAASNGTIAMGSQLQKLPFEKQYIGINGTEAKVKHQSSWESPMPNFSNGNVDALANDKSVVELTAARSLTLQTDISDGASDRKSEICVPRRQTRITRSNGESAVDTRAFERRANARTSSVFRESHCTHLSTAQAEQGKPRTLGKPVFADAAAMKDKVRQAIFQAPYRVSDFYWDTGIAQMIARSYIFEQVMLVVIGANSLWIAIDTEYNHADVLLHASPLFFISENIFCTLFFFEWLVRFMAFRRKLLGLRDQNFLFDTGMVFFMVVETWVVTFALAVFGTAASGEGISNAGVLRVVRLLRLTRMARMARLLREMPELMILLKAIFVAFRSVFFTICLLIIIIYMFAIAFVQLTDDTHVGHIYFDGVASAMGTLLLAGSLPDHSQFVSDVTSGHFIWGILLMGFIFLAPMTVMGMLAGVLVEVVSVVSSVEKESMVVSFVTEQLHMLLQQVDEDGNRRLTRTEFQQLIVRPDAARMMASVGVDVVGLAEYCDFLFGDNELISFSEFIDLVLQLRGTNQATVKDIVDLRKFMKQELTDTVSGEMSLFQERLCVRLPDLVARTISKRNSAVHDPPLHAEVDYVRRRDVTFSVGA